MNQKRPLTELDLDRVLDGPTVHVDYPKPGDPDYVRRDCGADLLTPPHEPRDTSDCWKVGREYLREMPVDRAIALIENYPEGWQPQNRHYVKNHVNAPGTVRSWFRQMRAADFARSIHPNAPLFRIHGVDAEWTLFDTQKVIDRETAAHYERPTFDELFECYRRMRMSIPPPRDICSKCGGPVRLVGAPFGYVGPASGSLLYLYTKWLEPDYRYLSSFPAKVWMCDACQYAGVRSDR